MCKQITIRAKKPVHNNRKWHVHTRTHVHPLIHSCKHTGMHTHTREREREREREHVACPCTHTVVKHFSNSGSSVLLTQKSRLLNAFIQSCSPLLVRLTALACDSNGWLAFCGAFLNVHQSGALTALAWLVPRETAAVSARSVYSIQPCTMSLHAKPHT